MGEYIDREDLRVALGPQRYVAYFDDDKDGIPENEGADQVIMRAEARLSRYAAEAFGASFPLPSGMPVPDGFRALAIEYAIVIAEARISAVSRDDAEKRLEALDLDMKDMVKGTTKISVGQPSPRAGMPSDDFGPPPPGALAAGLINFGGHGHGSDLDEWWRKEGR